MPNKFFKLNVHVDSESCGINKGERKSWDNWYLVVQPLLPVEIVPLDKIIPLIYLMSDFYWEFYRKLSHFELMK